MSETGISTDSENKGNVRLHLTWKRFLKIIFHLWRQFDDPYYTGFAAQIAYFFFMSSVPMLIVLTQVLGLFDISMDFIKEWLDEHLSSEMGSFLSGLFNASSTAVSNVLLIILALWASSSLAFSLSRLSTYTLTRGRYRFNFFTERAKSIPMAMVSLLVVAASLIVYVYGELIAMKVFNSVFITKLIGMLRTPVLGLLFFMMILVNYYLLPRVRVPLMAVMPGAIVATIGLLLATWIYSLYTSNVANYNLLYGAFSNIVAMMLWFYIISWVLCIGMMFNMSWDLHLRRGRLTLEKIKAYITEQYPSKSEAMVNRLIIEDYDMTDHSLDSIAVMASIKFDPGYAEKREHEIEALEEERQIRLRIEKELEDMIAADEKREEDSIDEKE